MILSLKTLRKYEIHSFRGRWLIQFFRVSAVLLIYSFQGGGPALAHIIPKENLHPVTEAYRRSVFVLNLNPIAWDVVHRDAKTIAGYRSSIGFGEKKALGENYDARAVFRELTRDVSAICLHHLSNAVALFEEPEQAIEEVKKAQAVWMAFSEFLQKTDPDGYFRLGQSWLGMANALGSRGLLGIGAVEADREGFNRAAKGVIDYLESNFGKNYEPPKNGKLAPFPVNSPTYKPKARFALRLPPGNNINKQIPRPRQILNMASRGVDESDTPLIAVGDMAFDSAFIYGEPMRSIGMSCNSCHNKSITNPNFFIPGLSQREGGMDVSNSFFAPHANNGHFDPIDIPDLRGIRFTAPYGRNGRFASLREFARNVIVNEFNGPEPEPVILDGLVAYMNEFDFLPNRYLEKDGRLANETTPEARLGEKLFNKPFSQMGGMSCASCHIPSANFVDHKRHDIGSIEGAGSTGKDGALDTPTLLGILWSPPYFHDGSQPTLRSVVNWFDQTYRLNLKTGEIENLTAYLETVGGGTDPYEDTPYYLDAEMEEFYFFISAYEFLAEKNLLNAIDITFQTIALEIRNHKWELQDLQYLPVMEKMADVMDEAHAANQSGNFEQVREKVAEYRALYAENKEVLK